MTTARRSPAPCRAAVAALAVAAAACGSSSNTCLSLAQSYADELPDALTCDPAAADPCAATRNVVQYAADDRGQLTLESLGSCQHSANAARTSKLDAIFSAYEQAGCRVFPSPICPTPKDRCVPAADGGSFTCFP